MAVGLADSVRIVPEKTKAAAVFRAIRILICVTIILMTVIYVAWPWWGSMISCSSNLAACRGAAGEWICKNQ